MVHTQNYEKHNLGSCAATDIIPTTVHREESEKSIVWNDTDLKIDWPLHQIDEDELLISEKDSNGLTMKKAEELNFLF